MIVRALDLTVRYGDRTLLDGLTLELDRGETCAVVGRSGSGKTTLLLALAGLLTPSTGNVQHGVEPSDIQYVPQAASLLPELSALDNAALALRVRGSDPRSARDTARRALADVGLSDAADALPDDLSRGMQQRVALARSLAVGPALLLADEPTGTLDRDTGRQVAHALMESCHRSGATLVVATHDQGLVTGYDRVLELAS